MTLTEFLLARIAEDEAPTWRLLDWETPPDWPAGYVGRECLICRDTSFGGTADAMTQIAEEHDEAIHRRSRVLADCKAKRSIVQPYKSGGGEYGEGYDAAIEDVLCLLALPYADHPDYREEWKP